MTHCSTRPQGNTTRRLVTELLADLAKQASRLAKKAPDPLSKKTHQAIERTLFLRIDEIKEEEK